jgi:hypothetical protein
MFKQGHFRLRFIMALVALGAIFFQHATKAPAQIAVTHLTQRQTRLAHIIHRTGGTGKTVTKATIPQHTLY